MAITTTQHQLLMHLLDAEIGAGICTDAPAYQHSDIAALQIGGLITNIHETGRWHVTDAGCEAIFPGVPFADPDGGEYDAEDRALAGWNPYAT